MAFIKSAYGAIPSHCKAVIEGLSLENSIKLCAMDAHETRITFTFDLSQEQKNSLASEECFINHLDHAGRDAVVLERFM